MFIKAQRIKKYIVINIFNNDVLRNNDIGIVSYIYCQLINAFMSTQLSSVTPYFISVLELGETQMKCTYFFPIQKRVLPGYYGR